MNKNPLASVLLVLSAAYGLTSLLFPQLIIRWNEARMKRRGWPIEPGNPMSKPLVVRITGLVFLILSLFLLLFRLR